MSRDKIVLTYQDYLRMPEDHNRREILGGDLYVTPAPSPLHQRAVVNLIVVLEAYLSRHPSGKLYTSPIDVVLSDIDVVQPDLAFVTTARLHIVTSTAIQGPPDLVVEVLSPSTSGVDRGRKMQTYARFGVREYWIADPDSRSIEVFGLQGGAYRSLPPPGIRPELGSELFPDLTFDLQSLWD